MVRGITFPGFGVEPGAGQLNDLLRPNRRVLETSGLEVKDHEIVENLHFAGTVCVSEKRLS